MIEESVKNRIVLIVSILCLIFFVWAVGASSELSKQKRNLEDEIRKRMSFEEQNTNILKEKSILEEKVKELTTQLEERDKALEEVKSALNQEQLVNKSIKQELEKVTKLKETLEEDLKDALMKARKQKKKK